MSPIALGLDILLVTLLVSALVTGWRLNKRLKALREGQAGFVKAVAELDSAAARAEAGLKALREASDTTHDDLLTRIETARGLIARLEAANAAAARLAPPAKPEAPAPAAPLRRSEARLDPRFRPAPPRPGARGVDDDLFESVPEELSALAQRLERRP